MGDFYSIVLIEPGTGLNLEINNTETTIKIMS